MVNEHYLRRNVVLELRLAVLRGKFERLRREADYMVEEVLGKHTNKHPEEAAEQLQAVLRELENTAINLHE